MISSSGYFKSVNCPFYQNGLCERPYCHFRHVKQEIQAISSKTSSHIPEDASGTGYKFSKRDSEAHLDLLTMVQKVVEEKARILMEVSSFSEPTKFPEFDLLDNNVNEKSGGSSHTAFENKYQILSSTPTIPEYKPTPIAELKKMMVNKYRMSPKHKVNDMEYDPVSNFSTDFPSSRRSSRNGKTHINLKRQYSYSNTNNSNINNDKKLKLEYEPHNKFPPVVTDDCVDPLQIDAKFSSEDEAESVIVPEEEEVTVDSPLLFSCDTYSSFKIAEKNKKEVDTKDKNTNNFKNNNIIDKNDKHLTTVEKSNNDLSLLDCKNNKIVKIDKQKIERQSSFGKSIDLKLKTENLNDEIVTKENFKETSESETGHKNISVNNINKTSITEKIEKLSHDKEKTKKKLICKENSKKRISISNKNECDYHTNEKNKNSSTIEKNKQKDFVNEKHKKDSSLSEKSKKRISTQEKSKKDYSVSEKGKKDYCTSEKINSKNDQNKKNVKDEKNKKDNHAKEKSKQDNLLGEKSKKEHFSNEKHKKEISVSEKDKKYNSKNEKNKNDNSLYEKSKRENLANENSQKTVFKIVKNRNDSSVHVTSKKSSKKSKEDNSSSNANEKVIDKALSKHELKSHLNCSDEKDSAKSSKSKNSVNEISKDSIKISKGLNSINKLKPQINVSHIDLFGEDSDEDQSCSSHRFNKIEKEKMEHNLFKNLEIIKNNTSHNKINNKVISEVNIMSRLNEQINKNISKCKSKGNTSINKRHLFDDEILLRRKSPAKLQNALSENSDDDFMDVDTDLDDHDTYEECLRIFNEPLNANNYGVPTKAKIEKKDDENEIPNPMRKRIAHEGAANSSKIRPKLTNNHHPSPAQILYNRYLQLQKAAEAAKAAILSVEGNSLDSSILNSLTGTNSNNSSNVDKRISEHLPSSSASYLLDKQKKVKPSNTLEASDIAALVLPSLSKVVKRIAHIPSADIIKRPTIAVEYGSKVATNIRQRYLNVFCDEFLKIYSKAEDAYERAKQEEQAVYDRSTSRTVYLNVAVNAVKRFRNEATANTSKESSALLKSSSKRSASAGIANQPASKKMSHEAMLGGAKAAKMSYSVKRSISRTISLESLTELDLYKLLEPYILSKEDLEKHGFPRLGPDKSGKAVVLRTYEVKQVNCSDTINRTCARCNKTFRISPSGHYITKEECVYHWGKAWKKKIAGNLETRYTCCQGDSESDGCCLAKVHVSDYKDYDNLVGFVSTQPKSPLANKNYGTFALDCEMCYTANGAELTRITVIGTNLKPVYETLVKPDSPIVDYNTRFSGITEVDMKNVTTTLRDVQAVLLSTFGDKTILIGHSLESDFMALKLIHNTVIDTSIVFPHRLGLPYKRALRTLMAEYIKKIIQADTSGHDSQEDAAACMELMLWKIKEDLKKLLR